MTTVEEMVRQVLAACDPDVIKSVANGVDPLTLTSGDLVEAANRLSELLDEQPTMINNQAFFGALPGSVRLKDTTLKSPGIFRRIWGMITGRSVVYTTTMQMEYSPPAARRPLQS